MRTKMILTAFVALVLSYAAGCGIPEEEHNKAISDLEAKLMEAKAANAKAKEQINELRSRNAALIQKLERLGVDVDRLKDEAEANRKMVEQARQRLETFRKMLEQFQSMIKSGKLRVRIVKGRMVVEMSSNILFESGKSDLSEEGKDALGQVASVLATIPNREFQVAGHTDNIPIKNRRFKSNWELSTARAVTVVNFFIEMGVEDTKLSAAGYAETQPVGDNNTEEGRALNRRIEIVLMPNLDELPDLSALEEMTSNK